MSRIAAKSLTNKSFLCLFFGVILTDQITKIFFEKNRLISFSHSIINNYSSSESIFFSWQKGNQFIHAETTYVRNTGAAWGLFNHMEQGIRTVFFYAIMLLSAGVLSYMFRCTSTEHKWRRLSIVLILAGAVGNFIDRARLHYVIDWIHVYWRILGWQYDYPVFNIADSFVCIGVFIFIITEFAEKNKEKRK